MNIIYKSIQNTILSALLSMIFMIPLGIMWMDLSIWKWADVAIVFLISFPVLFMYHVFFALYSTDNSSLIDEATTHGDSKDETSKADNELQSDMDETHPISITKIASE